jgi:hypothetical protein
MYMKKSFFSGMAMLLMGVAFVGCSSEVSVDPDYAHKKKVMEYDAAFQKEFGTIAKGHDWGFAQTSGTSTRSSMGGSEDGQLAECDFVVPEDITQWKNGNCANQCVKAFHDGEGVDIDEIDFTFDYYWLQHYNTAEGLHNIMKQVQAYDANANNGEGAWIDVVNFEAGKNEKTTYFKVNSSSHGTTLMLDMGGNAGDPAEGPSHGKLFRWEDYNGDYHYDYKFLNYSYRQNKNKKFEALVLGLKNDATHWWLIVVKPAVPKDPTKVVVEEGRIMCEDMGDIGDFDFNDVVFDAKRYWDGSINVKVLAAGGTLPIEIDGVDVYKRFGTNMVNTGVNSAEPFEIDIDANADGTPKYASIKDIPVVVNPGGEAAPYELKAELGKAPQKICSYINTSWSEEYVSIKSAYTLFEEWVRANNPKKWIEVEVAKFTDLDLLTK